MTGTDTNQQVKRRHHIWRRSENDGFRTPKRVLQWLAIIGISYLSYYGFSRFGVQIVEVVGKSMSPTLQDSDHYLLKRWVYVLREPRRSEVVVFNDPDQKGFSVKRVVGVEGDTVTVKDGSVFVNGERLDEPYLPLGTQTSDLNGTNELVFECGKDEFFLLGDNRNFSVDSREYGPVQRQNILGLIVP